MLLANVRPAVGVGKGANVTVLLLGTLRDASVGAVGCGDGGTAVARGVATLRDVTGRGGWRNRRWDNRRRVGGRRWACWRSVGRGSNGRENAGQLN